MSEEIKKGTPNANDQDQADNASKDFLDLLRSMMADEAETEDDDNDSTEENGEKNTDLLRHLFDDDNDEDNDDEDDDEDDEDDEGSGCMKDADDFHNDAVDISREGNFRGALNKCLQGLKYFPSDIDLLADVIKYGSKVGEMDIAEQHFLKLEQIDKRMWNWRAYTFAFDWLVEKPVINEAACRSLIADYRRFLPYEEKALVASSELESALGNDERAMNVLIEAIHTLPNASQCALRLADMQMDRGLYEAVVETVGYGLAACAEVQPSINISYLYLLRALSKDSLLHRKVYRNEQVTQEEIDRAIQEYEMIQQEFMELRMRHGSTIKRHISMLKLLKLNV